MASAKTEAAALRRLSKIVVVAGQKAAVESLRQLEGQIKVRIFRRGLDYTGRKIGRYSTKPFYLSLKGQKKSTGSQINFGGQAGRGVKNDGPKFADGRPRKSRYYKGGYKGFRNELGFNSGFVDLSLSGNLKGQFTSGFRKNGGVLGYTSQEAAKIAQGNEKRFNATIFTVSRTEQANVAKVIDRTIKIAVNNALPKE